jgi:hypothetical protein
MNRISVTVTWACSSLPDQKLLITGTYLPALNCVDVGYIRIEGALGAVLAFAESNTADHNKPLQYIVESLQRHGQTLTKTLPPKKPLITGIGDELEPE